MFRVDFCADFNLRRGINGKHHRQTARASTYYSRFHNDGPFFTHCARILSWTHTSTGTHLSTTSNIFTKMGPIELKLCICTLVDIPITIVVFFVCQVARKTRLKKRPLSRWPMDAVSELQPAKRDRICIASCLGVLSSNLSLFWTVTGGDRSKGGSRSKCGSMIVPKPSGTYLSFSSKGSS